MIQLLPRSNKISFQRDKPQINNISLLYDKPQSSHSPEIYMDLPQLLEELIQKEQVDVQGRNTKIARPCPFCSIPQTNSTRHILSKHKDNERVKLAAELSASERNKAFSDMKKEGILAYNKEQMKNGGQYAREKRQNSLEPMVLVMCDTCSGFVARSYFARHRKVCIRLLFRNQSLFRSYVN
jgi:hypothetical protein